MTFPIKRDIWGTSGLSNAQRLWACFNKTAIEHKVTADVSHHDHFREKGNSQSVQGIMAIASAFLGVP